MMASCPLNNQLSNYPQSSSGSDIGTTGILTVAKVNNEITTSMRWNSKNIIAAELPDFALKFFVKLFRNTQPACNKMKFKILTEHKRNGVIFRSHPLYRSKQAWHDWCMFRYEKENKNKRNWNTSVHGDMVHFGDDEETSQDYDYAPGKVLTFVENNDGTVDALILGCHFQQKTSSPISTYWKIQYEDAACKQPYVNLVSVDSIVCHCMMIPENDELNGYHEIWDRELWAKSFL